MCQELQVINKNNHITQHDTNSAMAEFVSLEIKVYNVSIVSIVSKILEELWNTELKYKGVSVNLFGIPKFPNYSKRSLRTTVDRLNKKEFIRKETTGIVLSEKGRKFVERKMQALKTFSKLEGISKTKTLLVMFDIPTERKAEREWFRWHLKKFGYILVQKSVWVGPSPLPKDFLSYIKEIHLENCIKTFKLSNPYKEK